MLVYYFKLVEYTDNLARWILGILTFLMVIDVFAQVIWRYGLVSPIFWADEAARYLFIWISFLGAAVALGEKIHYGFDYLVLKFPPGYRRKVEILVGTIVGLFLLLCIIEGLEAAIIVMAQKSPSLRIRMGWVYLALPSGATLMLLHLITQMIKGNTDESTVIQVE